MNAHPFIGRMTARTVGGHNTGKVRDYMTRKVVTCSPHASLLEVQGLLADRDLTRTVVVDTNRNPVGIISQKDVMRFALTDKTKRRFEEVHAHEVMSCGLTTIKPDARMAQAAEAMIRQKRSSLLVRNGGPEGIVTKTDIARYLDAEGGGIYSVGHFMTLHPVTVNPTQSIFSIIDLMSQREISRVIVVEDNNKAQGIITLADFSRRLAYSLFNLSKTLLVEKDEAPAVFLERAEAIGLKAKHFMTQHPITLSHDLDLADAARLMMKHDISGLPVTDNSENLVGIVSKTDITRAVAYERDSTAHTILRNPYSKLNRMLPFHVKS
jgi:CBS domain-containing protein